MSAEPDLVDEFLAMVPALTIGAFRDIEKLSRQAGTLHGINRRIMLAMLTRSGEQLIEGVLAEPEAMLATYECSAGTVAYYSDIGHMLDAAQNRLMVALCGIDTDAPDAPFTQERLDKATDETERIKVWGKSKEELSLMGLGESPTDTEPTQ